MSILNVYFIFNSIHFHIFYYLVLFILTLLPILIAVAYIILAERKVMASIQRRKGPNVVGLFGLLQPFIDAVKLLTKEQIYPLFSNLFIFWIGPVLTLIVSLLSWMFIPFNYNNFYYDFNYSLLFLLTISSFSVYGLSISGWSSNSKYAILGAVRTISQFISYELVLTISLLPVIFLTGSLNFIDIVSYQAKSVWFIIPLWPIAYIFFIAMLAETNRTPFDLPEAEAELVAGYNVEYSSVFFIFFMFAEYNSLLVMSTLFSLVFLGGWNWLLAHEITLSLKITFISLLFILIRATQPRFRFDQLLILCWKKLLPLSFSIFLFTINYFIFIKSSFTIYIDFGIIKYFLQNIIYFTIFIGEILFFNSIYHPLQKFYKYSNSTCSKNNLFYLVSFYTIMFILLDTFSEIIFIHLVCLKLHFWYTVCCNFFFFTVILLISACIELILIVILIDFLISVFICKYILINIFNYIKVHWNNFAHRLIYQLSAVPPSVSASLTEQQKAILMFKGFFFLVVAITIHVIIGQWIYRSRCWMMRPMKFSKHYMWAVVLFYGWLIAIFSNVIIAWGCFLGDKFLLQYFPIFEICCMDLLIGAIFPALMGGLIHLFLFAKI